MKLSKPIHNIHNNNIKQILQQFHLTYIWCGFQRICITFNSISVIWTGDSWFGSLAQTKDLSHLKQSI